MNTTRTVIAIASGKGGTGKTTVATNLAHLAAQEGRGVTYLDCDVEEPNGHIFLRPEIEKVSLISVPVPVVDVDLCTACGKCGAICEYNAIAMFVKTVLTFPALCHGCGGCTLVCPSGAISEGARVVGVVEEGHSGTVGFVHGKLRIGEAMSPPLIRAVQARLPAEGLAIIDAPPGTSCPVIQAVRGADYVLLVTEPTPFGLNDLKLAVEMLRVLRLPCGVVVNRADMGDEAVFDYCAEESLEILLTIPDDRRIAEAYSRGELATVALPEYRQAFANLLARLQELTGPPGQAAPLKRWAG
jgi:MinD superfamily P-loop ATPase